MISPSGVPSSSSQNATNLDRQIIAKLVDFSRNPGDVDYISTQIEPILTKYETQKSFTDAITLILERSFIPGPGIVSYVNLFQRLQQIVISNEKHQLIMVKDVLADILFKGIDINQKGFDLFVKRLSFAAECLNKKILPITVFKGLMQASSQLGGDLIALRFQFEILRCASMLVDNRFVAWNGKLVQDFNFDRVVARLKDGVAKNIFTDRTLIADINGLLNHLKEEKRWQPNEMPQLEPSPVTVDLTAEPSHSGASRPNRTSPTRPIQTQLIDLAACRPQFQRSRPRQLVPRKTLPAVVTPATSCQSLPSPLLPTPLVSGRAPPTQQRPTNLSLQLQQSVSLHPQSYQQGLPPPLLSSSAPPISFKSLISSLIKSPESLPAITTNAKTMLTKEATKQSFTTNVKTLLDAVACAEPGGLEPCVKLFENLQNLEIKHFPSNTPITFREIVQKTVVFDPYFSSLADCVNFCATLPLTRELYRIGLVSRDVFEYYINKLAKEDSEMSAYLILEVMRTLNALVESQVAKLTEEELKFWEGQTTRLENMIHTSVFEATLSGNLTAFLDSLNQKGGFRRKICCCKAELVELDSLSQPAPSTSVEAAPPAVPVRPSSTGTGPRILGITSAIITPVTQPLTLQMESMSSRSLVSSDLTPTQRPSPIIASVPQRITENAQPTNAQAQTPPVQRTPAFSEPSFVRPQLSSPGRSSVRPPQLPASPVSNRRPSGSQQENDFRTLVCSITPVYTGNSPGKGPAWLKPVKEQLKSFSTPLAFMNALSLLFVKIFELANSEGLDELAKICIDLCKTDYGRGRSFFSELEHFCVKYASGQNKADLDRAKNAVETDSGRAETLSALMCPPLEEEERTLADEIAALEDIFLKRRIGCVRLVGKLFIMKQFDFKLVKLFSDALLSVASEQTLECLLELLADIGPGLAETVRAEKAETWWTGFFDDLVNISQNPNASDKVKKLVSDIRLEKEAWYKPDPKKEACKKLAGLLSSLTEFAKSPTRTRYQEQSKRIRHLIASQCSDEHTQHLFEIYQRKVDELLLSKGGSSSRPTSTSSLASGRNLGGPQNRKRTGEDTESSSAPKRTPSSPQRTHSSSSGPTTNK